MRIAPYYNRGQRLGRALDGAFGQVLSPVVRCALWIVLVLQRHLSCRKRRGLSHAFTLPAVISAANKLTL